MNFPIHLSSLILFVILGFFLPFYLSFDSSSDLTTILETSTGSFSFLLLDSSLALIPILRTSTVSLIPILRTSTVLNMTESSSSMCHLLYIHQSYQIHLISTNHLQFKL
ncbi:hypothetical protein HanIR_Chr13g0645011 [Helianthus annuus]|nr:hypothetical protein HanIR_Chr13g0645011 [Helianthus annuus]